MRMRRQMSEGRPGGNVRKKKKDNLNNRMALVGVTMVVLSLAAAASAVFIILPPLSDSRPDRLLYRPDHAGISMHRTPMPRS